jgi:hypothetical protein
MVELREVKKLKKIESKKVDIHIKLIQKEEVFQQRHRQEVLQVEEV